MSTQDWEGWCLSAWNMPNEITVITLHKTINNNKHNSKQP